MPKSFISYAWETDEHKKWVKTFAERLREDGVEVVLDQWNLIPGDQLPEFMEKSIRENDFVLIICTPRYKDKSDNRSGGVGYEGDIMTAELFVKGNQRKFIPILRDGKWDDAAPSWLLGKYHIDLRGTSYSEVNYNDLLATLHNIREDAPKIGKIPVERIQNQFSKKNRKISTSTDNSEPVKIEGIIVDEVSNPKVNGFHGSALYKVPFKLSRKPSVVWKNAFIQTWNRPPSYTGMHRPGIASVTGNKIILDGTTIEEVAKYHRETLKLSVEKANKIEKELLAQQKKNDDIERARIEKHKIDVREAAEQIKFD